MSERPSDPRSIYERRLADHRRRVARQRAVERRFSWVRLALFVALAALVWPTLFARSLALGWLLLPLAAFAIAVVWHERVVRARAAGDRAVAYYERGLARIDDRWAGAGAAGVVQAAANHPYAADLDVLGVGSLFELLCVARSRAGQATLAGWLLEPATPDRIRARHVAVDELCLRLDLREALAVAGEDVTAGVDPVALSEWAESAPVIATGWPTVGAAACAVANLIALGGWFGSLWDGSAALTVLATGAIFATALRGRVRRALAAIDRPERELEMLGELLGVIESQRFHAPRLVELRGRLDVAGRPPSRSIARLVRLVQTNESRRNMLFAPLAALVLAGTQLACAAERWRAAHGRAVRRWLDSLGEIEALAALAGYAYEHPADPFPELVDDGPLFDGHELGHPLLPAARCVRNDVSLGDGCRLWVVSGSNMSGKSTLLRTVGVNAVLAQAGAPIRGRSLRISPLTLGASMRVQDSLQEGVSHFYAELKRLRGLVDRAEGRLPLLFLLDELFHGTNSHDRRIGAEALLRGLVDRGAIGLVTTHDLALAEIADALGSRAANVHFEDRLQDGRVTFDFRLRPGVVRRSNALDLMRAVGLDV